MRVLPVFYMLSSSTRYPCSMSKATYAGARGTWLCPGCASPKPDQKAIDAMIEEVGFESAPLNFIFGTGLGIVHKELLFALGEDEARQCLYLGRLFREDGKLLKEWATFHGKHRIFVRGSNNAQYRQCFDCGKHLYFATGTHYLYPEPQGGVSIFHSGGCGLVITEELTRRLTINKWRMLVCEQLRVLRAPLDGLSELPQP